MKSIIVDLEATCWEQRKGRKSEIIEIGAICIDSQKQVISEFNQIIKPVINPSLSEFCTELTSITQNMVDEGVHFMEALHAFQNWINITQEDYLLCSWGYYDKNQFIYDCQLHALDTEWTENHISIKHQYALIKSLRRPVGMKTALKIEDLPLEGIHHRGIDDARNIAKIFIKYFDYWNPAGIKSK